MLTLSRKRLALTSVMVVLILILAGCGGSTRAAGEQSGQAVTPPAPGQAGFTEYPIGDEQQAQGLNIALVYFQPVPMEPEARAGLKPAEADIHLEADITADRDNPLGFGLGEFIPYLQVKYEIENGATGERQSGSLMPMNASDGPHYGANIKLGPAGTYRIAFNIKAPEDFLLHTDPETGVPGRFWKEPIELEWEFPWVPRQW